MLTPTIGRFRKRRVRAQAQAPATPDPESAVLTGTFLPYGGATAPQGYLACDGSAVSRSIYSALFAVLGTAYGAGDGVDTFNLPDFRGRALLGAGAGAGLTPRQRGDSGGAERVVLTAAQMPQHSHQYTELASLGTETVEGQSGSGYPFVTAVNVSMGSAGVTETGNNQPHENLPPFGVVMWMVKT